MQATPSMNVEIGDNIVSDEQPIYEEVIAETDSAFAMGPGFGGGGASGGGGAGGGGGGLGLGGIAAIGGLTALGIIAGTNNDAPVASPIVPVPVT